MRIVYQSTHGQIGSFITNSVCKLRISLSMAIFRKSVVVKAWNNLKWQNYSRGPASSGRALVLKWNCTLDIIYLKGFSLLPNRISRSLKLIGGKTTVLDWVKFFMFSCVKPLGRTCTNQRPGMSSRVGLSPRPEVVKN